MSSFESTYAVFGLTIVGAHVNFSFFVDKDKLFLLFRLIFELALTNPGLVGLILAVDDLVCLSTDLLSKGSSILNSSG